MAVDSASYDPLQYIAGSSEIRTIDGVVPGTTADIPGLTPMTFDIENKIVPALNATDLIVGVLVPAMDSQEGNLIGTVESATDQTAAVYTDVDLFGDQINWTNLPLLVTDLEKAAYFTATGINLVFPLPGQV